MSLVKVAINVSILCKFRGPSKRLMVASFGTSKRALASPAEHSPWKDGKQTKLIRNTMVCGA